MRSTPILIYIYLSTVRPTMIATNGKSPTTPHGTHHRRFLCVRNLDRGERKLIIESRLLPCDFWTTSSPPPPLSQSTWTNETLGPSADPDKWAVQDDKLYMFRCEWCRTVFMESYDAATRNSSTRCAEQFDCLAITVTT